MNYSDLKKGQIIDGVIKRIDRFYLIVHILGTRIFALLHISEISNKFIQDLNIIFETGQKLKAEIIEVDPVKQNVKLSIKNLEDFRLKDEFVNEIKPTKLGFSTLENNLDTWIKNTKS